MYGAVYQLFGCCRARCTLFAVPVLWHRSSEAQHTNQPLQPQRAVHNSTNRRSGAKLPRILLASSHKFDSTSISQHVILSPSHAPISRSHLLFAPLSSLTQHLPLDHGTRTSSVLKRTGHVRPKIILDLHSTTLVSSVSSQTSWLNLSSLSCIKSELRTGRLMLDFRLAIRLFLKIIRMCSTCHTA